MLCGCKPKVYTHCILHQRRLIVLTFFKLVYPFLYLVHIHDGIFEERCACVVFIHIEVSTILIAVLFNPISVALGVGVKGHYIFTVKPHRFNDFEVVRAFPISA